MPALRYRNGKFINSSQKTGTGGGPRPAKPFAFSKAPAATVRAVSTDPEAIHAKRSGLILCTSFPPYPEPIKRDVPKVPAFRDLQFYVGADGVLNNKLTGYRYNSR